MTVALQRLGPLHGNVPDATRRRMDKDLVTGRHPIGGAQQIARRHAFEHHCGGGIIGYLRRQLEQPVRRDIAPFRISANSAAAVGHAVTRLDVVTPGPTASTTPAASRPIPDGKGTG